MTGRLSGKSILITGAAQGIGLAMARAFLAEDAAVALLDSDAEELQHALSSLGGPSGRIFAKVADITRPTDFTDAIAEAEETIPPLNALVNNAGINVFRDPLETTDDDWQLCLDVDLKGAWNGIRAILPRLIERGGGVVLNIASTHAFTIIPGSFPYPVAKHGLIGLTKALGIEYAPRDIRVNALAPGYVATEKVIAYWNSFPDPEAAKARTLALHPGGRIATPEEIALAALFLVSDECPFINATCLTADGGLSILHHPA
ncbi:SDR family oxidoreductase [Pararhizobium mangrovi]|uniref:SDR family oxidoreductase n=1 Tax=Pararhizobium mangrovi TaxID=2590452 RepID=A0A506UBY9_9HYPH|nr:SDR family oxidoreductase [Pararhizobium mangrovi]TPW30345.1 SDR family oxidoreductase [Pararhizobium mangrovi]